MPRNKRYFPAGLKSVLLKANPASISVADASLTHFQLSGISKGISSSVMGGRGFSLEEGRRTADFRREAGREEGRVGGDFLAARIFL